jgi:hypothetical protein
MNVHGTNPKARKDIGQRQAALETQARAQERIQRAHEKEARRVDRKIAEAGQAIVAEHKPLVENLFSKILSGMEHGTIGKTNRLIRALAVDDWFIDRCEEEAIKRRIITEKLLPGEREILSFVGGEMRTKYIVALLGENPTILVQRDIMDQIKKWKGRVPGMLKGHY